MTFQKLVLGDQPIETEKQKRKILLGVYLILMYLGIDAFFFIVNLFNSQGTPVTLLIGTIVSFICLILIKQRWVDTALFLHLARSNFFAFYFSTIDVDPYQTGVYLYFIPCALGPLAVFGYHERWKGISFALISFTLFVISIFEPSKFSPQEPHFYFITNFLVVLTVGLLILLFFDRMVIESENKVIQKNDELLKTNMELDRFVYSASHDLRAPLSSILGLVQIYHFTADENKRKEIVDYIQTRALKLDDFIREILDYARNTRIEVMHTTVDLHEVVRGVLDNLRFIKGFEKIRTNIECPSNGEVKTEPERLKVILTNLLSNAIKYQDPGKNEPFIKVTIEKENSWYSVIVQDNGIGIKPNHQPKVFDMFYRANDSVEGSGLGLYIVKETVERLHGRIEMTSEFGQGTTFKVSLPIVD